MLGRRNPPDSTFDFLSDPTQLPSEFKGWLRNWLLNQPATTTGTATALPTGNAGGDLTGSTYPSPVLKASGVTAATYGDSTHVAQVAVNAKGLVTGASNVALAAAGYATVQDEGTPLTQRSTMNFVGAGVTATDSGSLTTVTIPGGGGGGAVTQICNVLLGASQASFDTNTILGGNISGSYNHLLMEYVLRSDNAGINEDAMVIYNNDSTAANYNTQRLDVNGATVSGAETHGTLAGGFLAIVSGNTAPAGYAGAGSCRIQGYKGTTFNKVGNAFSLNNNSASAGGNQTQQHSHIWLNTAAITRIKVYPLVGTNWLTGSLFSLYGIT